MSGNLAYALPIRPARESAPLELVAPRARRRSRPKLSYALAAVGGIFVILLAQLLLSIALSNGAYSIARLGGEQRDLGRVQQALTEQLNLSASTQNLVSNAHVLGMVPANSPVFLRLSDGKVVGGSASAALGANESGSTVVANSLLTGTDAATVTAPVGPASQNTGTAGAPPTAVTTTAAGQPTTMPAGDTNPAQSSNPGALPSPVTH
jgi:hypothetical protein